MYKSSLSVFAEYTFILFWEPQKDHNVIISVIKGTKPQPTTKNNRIVAIGKLSLIQSERLTYIGKQIMWSLYSLTSYLILQVENLYCQQYLDSKISNQNEYKIFLVIVFNDLQNLFLWTVKLSIFRAFGKTILQLSPNFLLSFCNKWI